MTELTGLVNMSNVEITPEQVRAARGLLGWSQSDLKVAAGVARATLADFEAGKRVPYDRTLADIRAALEKAGVIFVEENGEGPGVRLRKKRKK
jgi:transcriptional regulator with XRE-family HTH domain